MSRSLCLLILTLLAVAAPAPAPADDGTTVSTQQGAVTGSLVSPTVRQFLGIPYGASTAGANRFMAPQAAPVRSTTFGATSYGDSCPPQLGSGNAEFLSLIGLLQQQQSVPVSEDCLNLNVWAPAVSRPQGGAVMLWVYGGSGEFGTSNTPYYTGQYFVENNDDLVIVTINYRLNIFGFPSAPQLAGQPWNFGLLDLDAAIQWVSANIAAFGGDPDRITIFGESAGAIAVDAYAFSHPSDTIVKGIIAESGTASLSSLIAPSSTSAATAAWNSVAKAVGCGTTDDAAQFSCMQDVPWQTLQSAVVASGDGFTASPDGFTIFSDTSSRLAAGQFLKVPLLIGNNADEGDILVVALEESEFGFTSPIGTETLADAVTELAFTCPSAQTSNARVSAGVPTYRYVYEGVFPDITNNHADLRAFHSSEIPLVFDTYSLSTFNFSPTASEIALSQYMQGAWVAFAQNPADGLAAYGWPKYGPSTASIAELGNSANPSGATFSPSSTFDTGCDVVTAITPAVLYRPKQVRCVTGHKPWSVYQPMC